MTVRNKKWNAEMTNALIEVATGVDVVAKEVVLEMSEKLEMSPRSVGSKLRKMGYVVESLSVAKTAWTAEQTAELHQVLESNPGEFTYAEVAAQLSFEVAARTVQGKTLAEELTHLVKATPKKEVTRSYTAEEEAKFVELAHAGSSIDVIAAQLARTLPQIRGKALSLHREGRIDAIPKQDSTSRKAAADAFEGLDLANMTVAEIAVAVNKQERSVKSMITRRGVVCADYDGAAKRAKKDAVAAE